MKNLLSKSLQLIKNELVQRQWIAPPIPQLMIETTDHCNLECPFCSNKDISRKKFQMTEELFQKIVAEYAAMGGKLVRLYSTGEPLMCTKFFPFVEYCNAKGLAVRFTTNGLLLNEEKIKKILALNIDAINFSVEGTDKESYEKVRIGGKFENVMEVLNLMRQLRNQTGKKKPRIRIQTALHPEEENQDYIRRFCKLWAPYCDDFFFSPIGSQGGTNLNFKETISKKDRTRCSFFWNLMTVNNDGTVSCCCVDYNRTKIVGNVSQQSLQEIWNHQTFRRWRKDACHLNYEKISADCTRCTSISRSFQDRTDQLMNTYRELNLLSV